MKYVVITGVSTGIGYASASDLARRGYHVFGSVRKQADADRVKEALGEQFTPLLFDVSDEDQVRAAAASVRAAIDNTHLTALVNNAGIAVPGPLMYLTPDEVRYQFEVNIIGVLTVTQAFLPMLGAYQGAVQDPGRVINIGSVSGKIVYPFLGSYAMSKHALEAMSAALRRELTIYGIDVILLAAGSIRTPIWDKAEQADSSRFANTDYGTLVPAVQKAFVKRGRAGIPVSKVADVIRQAIESKRPKARYVVARKLLSGWYMPRLLPDRWFDRILTRRMGLIRHD